MRKSGVIIKDIKRKTTIPESEILRAVRIAYGVLTPDGERITKTAKPKVSKEETYAGCLIGFKKLYENKPHVSGFSFCKLSVL